MANDTITAIVNRFKGIVRYLDTKLFVRYKRCKQCGACCCKKYVVGDQIYIDRREQCVFLSPYTIDGKKQCLQFDKRLCPQRKQMFKFPMSVPSSCGIKPLFYKSALFLDSYLFLERRLKLNPMPEQPRIGPCSPIIHEPTAMELRHLYLLSWISRKKSS